MYNVYRLVLEGTTLLQGHTYFFIQQQERVGATSTNRLEGT